MILAGYIKAVLAMLSVALLAVPGACASAPVSAPVDGSAVANGLANAANLAPATYSATNAVSSVRVIISRDFGQTILTDKTLEINQKSNAMSVLQQATQVETAYGGGFVEGIDGLKTEFGSSGNKKQDWFYFVNGLVANTGALDYPLHDGDIEQWDFHSWSFRQLVPAMIGHFPQPFLSGSRGNVLPTLVVYQSGWAIQADNIQRYLTNAGVKNIETRELDKLSVSEKADCNLIVVAGPQSQMISGLNKEWKRLGFFAHFENGSLIAIDSAGKSKVEYKDSTGLIQASQNPWNPNGIGAGENMLLVISGTDDTGIESAVNCLIQKSIDWQFSFGVVVLPGEIIKLP
jgi:hypothetical protein